MSVEITPEKFTVFWHIKANGLTDMSDPKEVSKVARIGWGVKLTKDECQYIFSHYDNLEKEFKISKGD